MGRVDGIGGPPEGAAAQCTQALPGEEEWGGWMGPRPLLARPASIRMALDLAPCSLLCADASDQPRQEGH